ncbi:MAG: transglutaminase-like domain-containing protein [Myxococcota bacterium]
MMHRQDIDERFRTIANAQHDNIDLSEAAALIAAEEYPRLNPDDCIALLDRLAEELSPLLNTGGSDLDRLQIMIKYLRNVHGLRGNTQDFYDPRNTFINDVLSRGLGIPISLSVIYIEVGRRLNIPVCGVGFPQHFLMKHCGDPEFLLDPFAPEVPLSNAECKRRLIGLSTAPYQDDASCLNPISNRNLVARMLTNLEMIYLHKGQLHKALRAIDRILLMLPEQIWEYRVRGIVHSHLGEYELAEQDFETYLMRSSDAADSQSVQMRIDEIRALTARQSE